MEVALEHTLDSEGPYSESIFIWLTICAVVSVAVLVWRNGSSLYDWEELNEDIFLEVTDMFYWLSSAIVAPLFYMPELQVLATRTDRVPDCPEVKTCDVSSQTRGPAHDAVCENEEDISKTLARTKREILNTRRRVRRMTSNYFLKCNRVRARWGATSAAVCRTYSDMVRIQKQAAINDEAANILIRTLLYQRMANEKMKKHYQQVKNNITKWTPVT